MLETVIPQSPDEYPLVPMTYFIRMAVLYHEVLDEVPQPAVYRVAWRMLDEIDSRDVVGGIVIPTDGEQMLRWIEHRHPDLRCETRPITQPAHPRWPAYGFLCSERDAIVDAPQAD